MPARTILLMADSGDGKTCSLYYALKLYHTQTGKVARLITADGGGYSAFIDSGMVDQGIVDVYDISNAPQALSTLRKLACGYWPRGTNKEYLSADNTCMTTPEEWAKVGMVLVEGITSIADLWLQHMRNSPDKVAYKLSYEYIEDGMIFGGLQEGHYGLAQTELHQIIVQGFKMLPTDYVIFTSLVGKGRDKRTGLVYGPKGPGVAINAIIPQWFQDCLHLERLTLQSEDGTQYNQVVLWFEKHYDQEGIPYLCKARIPPELMPVVHRKYPQGYIPLDTEQGIGIYFKLLAALQKAARDKAIKAIKAISVDRSYPGP